MSEKDQISALSKNEKRFLSRWNCGLCGHRMDRPGCSSIHGQPCSEKARVNRRKNCLKSYKPRNTTNE